MKALEEEYKTLQREVWDAKPEDTKAEDVRRLREIRKQIGLPRALALSFRIRG